jgi:signal transduction histidine kinase
VNTLRPSLTNCRNLRFFLAGPICVCTLMILFVLGCQSRTRSSALPFRANFLRSDAWQAWGGAWTSQAAEVENASEERGAKLISRSGIWDDYQFEGDLEFTVPSGEAGVILRSEGEEEGVDSYHGYFAGLRAIDGAVEFGRADYGWRPLARRSLPQDADLNGWLHFRIVAIGCSFGLSVTLPDGRSTTLLAEDRSCIRSGHVGLRSSLTSAKWRNLTISPAQSDDLSAFASQLSADHAEEPSALAEIPIPPRVDRYLTATSREARKHAVQPGVQPIVDFLMSPGRHPNVTLQGVIISTPPLAAIQDDSGALIIPDIAPGTVIKLGDVVEAQGTVISERFRSRLEEATIRVLWSDTPIPPLAVTASQLTSGTYRGRSITVEGTLVSAKAQAQGYELVLRDQDYIFRALATRDFRVNPSDLDVGSRLRLRGTATSLPLFTNSMVPFTIIVDRIDFLGSPPWWSARHVLWLLLIVTALLVFVQFMLHRVQQWHLQSVLREREQLAFEMHDTLAQSFTGIAYQLQAASLEKRGEHQVQSHIRNALQMVHLSHREASRTISALRPQYRDAAAILSALRDSAERLSNGGALRIVTVLSGKNKKLPLQVTDALFRIGQEAISNAIQHAGCNELTIRLTLSKRETSLSVHDNGQGFSADVVREGLGVAGMRSRAAKIKARFEIATVSHEGTTITVRAALPMAGGLVDRVRAMLKLYSAGRSEEGAPVHQIGESAKRV